MPQQSPNHCLRIGTARLAEGRTAEVYPWEGETILKLYRGWCPRDWAEYEVKIAAAVYQAGIPSPRVEGLLDVDGRPGVVYERLEGLSMLQDLERRPWRVFEHARLLAKLQAEVHQRSIPGLPVFNDRMRTAILEAVGLDETLRARLLQQLESMPRGRALCHADFHPGNIILTGRGPVVIDWMTACSGEPWADVARSILLLGIGARGSGKKLNLAARLLVDLFEKMYLNEYKRLVPGGQDALALWLPLAAAARLAEQITPERGLLLRLIQQSYK